MSSRNLPSRFPGLHGQPLPERSQHDAAQGRSYYVTMDSQELCDDFVHIASTPTDARCNGESGVIFGAACCALGAYGLDGNRCHERGQEHAAKADGDRQHAPGQALGSKIAVADSQS